MTATLIDAVARALWLADAQRNFSWRGLPHGPKPEWYDEFGKASRCGGEFVEKWEGAARATLRAMLAHGPTDRMRAAGERAWMHRDLDDDESEPIRDCFFAMLRAELEDSQ